MRSEHVDTAAVLRGEDDSANGTPLAVRDGELARVRAYYPEEFLRRIADGELVAPPWRLLVDPVTMGAPAVQVLALFNAALGRGRWPKLDDVRRRFGRVSNHRAPGETEGQEALI